MANKPAPDQNNNDDLIVGFSNFESQKFVLIDDNSLRVKPTIGSLAFCALFVFLGFVMIAFWGAGKSGALDDTDSGGLLLFGFIFAAVGLWMYRSGNQQIVANKDVGIAFIESWSPTISLDKEAVIKHFQPNEIMAFQSTSRIVKKETRKRTATYTQYQVNVYTSDETRHNIFVTLKAESAALLGEKLAAIFKVPLRKG